MEQTTKESLDFWKHWEDYIFESEQREERKALCKQRKLQKIFDEAAYQELSKKDIKDMSWQEIELWNELKKSRTEDAIPEPDPSKLNTGIVDRWDQFDQNIERREQEQEEFEKNKKYYNDTFKGRDNKNTSPEDINTADNIFGMEEKLVNAVRGCMENPALDKFKLYNLELNIRMFFKLYREHAERQNRISETETPEFEIENEPWEDVPKMFIKRSDNGNLLVEGWSSIAEIDRSGDFLPMKYLKDNIRDFYMKNGSICLNHDINTQIGKLKSYEFKKNDQGKDGLFVVAEVFPKYTDYIESNINNKSLTGFSWHFRALAKKTCSDDSCYNTFEQYPESENPPLIELSICTLPMNRNAVITGIGRGS